MKSIFGIALAILFSSILSAGVSFAQGKPMIVNIDNPNFRKLVIAIPDFEAPKDADDELRRLAKEGADQLGRLLNFSGLFNVMGKAAYDDILKKMKGAGAAKDLRKGMDGIDLVQWKSIGVESLSVGQIMRDGSGIVLGLRTADIYRGKLVLGKKYTKIKTQDFPRLIRQYADHLLAAYTGKPGIFSSKIVFVGRREKKSFKQVFLCDFDGSNLVQITNGNYPHLSPSWSRDNALLKSNCLIL